MIERELGWARFRRLEERRRDGNELGTANSGLGHAARAGATLAFLSRHVPAPLFTEPLAQCLHTETGAPVALVRLADNGNLAGLDGRREASLTLDGSLQLSSQLAPTNDGFCLVNVGISNELHPPGWIASLLEQLRRRFIMCSSKP